MMDDKREIEYDPNVKEMGKTEILGMGKGDCDNDVLPEYNPEDWE